MNDYSTHSLKITFEKEIKNGFISSRSIGRRR
jgi:hypothetical protein